MEIDSTPVPPPQEYSDSPSTYQSESSMNFDYLQGLNEGTSDTGMDSSRQYTGADEDPTTSSYGEVDDSKAIDRPFNLNERFVTVIDELDARVEKFRKDALSLQEKRDFLLMSIDLIKSNDMLHGMMDGERDEIHCYIQRVNSRLSTVELNVLTIRDHSQEDSLSQINSLIDMMITMGDPVMSRQRCQQYLNSCCSSAEAAQRSFSCPESGAEVVDIDVGPVDKKFENILLGCTLDDQKNIKKRLQALMGYLNKQIVRN